MLLQMLQYLHGQAEEDGACWGCHLAWPAGGLATRLPSAHPPGLVGSVGPDDGLVACGRLWWQEADHKQLVIQVLGRQVGSQVARLLVWKDACVPASMWQDA